jgi:hypothetical protein
LSSTGSHLAVAFERVTGHPARYIDTSIEAYFNGPLKTTADMPTGYNADPNDKSTMTFRNSFTGFWNQWKHNIIKRDYAFLDEIHPNRIRNGPLFDVDSTGRCATPAAHAASIVLHQPVESARYNGGSRGQFRLPSPVGQQGAEQKRSELDAVGILYAFVTHITRQAPLVCFTRKSGAPLHFR